MLRAFMSGALRAVGAVFGLAADLLEPPEEGERDPDYSFLDVYSGDSPGMSERYQEILSKHVVVSDVCQQCRKAKPGQIQTCEKIAHPQAPDRVASLIVSMRLCPECRDELDFVPVPEEAN